MVQAAVIDLYWTLNSPVTCKACWAKSTLMDKWDFLICLLKELHNWLLRTTSLTSEQLRAILIYLDLNLNKTMKYMLSNNERCVHVECFFMYIDTVAADVSNRLVNFSHHIGVWT